MIKSIEQLKKLQSNPFYTFTPEEQQRLDAANSQDVALAPNEASTRPKVFTSRGNAAAKETGKLNKHSSDPVSE